MVQRNSLIEVPKKNHSSQNLGSLEIVCQLLIKFQIWTILMEEVMLILCRHLEIFVNPFWEFLFWIFLTWAFKLGTSIRHSYSF